MFKSVDWKWLIIGIIVAMFVIPAVARRLSKKSG